MPRFQRFKRAYITLWASVLPQCIGMAQGHVDAPVRGAIPRVSDAIRIDGRLDEYKNALCTPVEYFNTDLKNRPAQLFYLWDDEAFYVGVRTLDETPYAPDEPFWVGDAVEWYFDVRRDREFLSGTWGPGAVHCFFSGVDLAEIAPQFSLRPGFETAIPKKGVKVASRRTDHGMEIEFKLPWENFPKFTPAIGETIGIDAELSYSDGISRSFRSFAFGGPLSVDQPANLARVVLVEAIKADHWKSSGPVMMPIRVDIPWQQRSTPQVEARIAMPPYHQNTIGRITFEIRATDGKLLGEFDASDEEVVQANGHFIRRVARWPVGIAAAGAFWPTAVVYDSHGKELTRVAPRLVSVNMDQGY